VSEDLDRAGGDADEPGDRVDQSGLAGAVRSQQPEERTVGDRQVERVERESAVVVAFGERADLQRRRPNVRIMGDRISVAST
jgi:hypothetical protein